MDTENKTLQAIKILVVDDHALIRNGMIALLKKYVPEWEFFEAEDGVRAIRKAQEVNPDIILLDYHMPKLDGAKAANIIKKERPGSKIIMVSMDMDPITIIDMINAGVSGIVSKNSHVDELLQAIDRVQNGKQHMTETVSEIVSRTLDEKKKRRKSPGNHGNKLFTKRETEILKYIVKGSSAHDIAKILSLSIRTVENHKASMFQKSNVKSTVELVGFALKTGIVTAR